MALVVVAIVVTLGVVWMTFAAARGSLKANGLVGIRTTATQQSETAWQAGHKAALPFVIWGGFVVVIAGALMLLGVIPSWPEQGFGGLALLGLEVVILIVSAVVAHRAARAVPARLP